MKRIELAIAAVLLSAAPLGAAWAVERAGVTAAVRGEVSLDPVTGQPTHAARSGEDVFLGDGIISGDQSGLQLMLLDETIFTIGPNTDLTVDEFVYDPATGAGQMSASLTKGIFRFVAGKIAKGDPEDMTINLPTGTIGIRGTSGIIASLNEITSGSVALDLLGPELLDADFDPTRSDFMLAILLETQKDEDLGPKGMVVSAQGESVELTKPGWGSLLAPGLPPSPPFFAPDVIDMGSFLGNLTPSGPPGGGPGALLEDAGGGGGTLELGGLNAPIDSLMGPLGPPPPPDEGIRTESAIASTVGQATSFTTFDELFSLAGTAVYNGSGTFTQTLKNNNASNIQGTFSATLDIDFTNRTFCFGGCSISVDTNSFGGNISDSTGINPNTYDDEIGLAGGVLDQEDLTNQNFVGSSVGLLNTDGIIANQGAILILYDDGSGNQGAGAGLSDPR